MASNILNQWGGEGFVDIDDLVSKTGMTLQGGGTLSAKTVFGTIGEKWVNATSTSWTLGLLLMV